MEIKDVIDEITYINENELDDREKRIRLHELGWKLINTTRPLAKTREWLEKNGE
jgi:hypothetical protein